MSDKYTLFKNYLHNELGITREDIRTWITEGVEAEAHRLVKQEFSKFDFRQMAKDAIKDALADEFNNPYRQSFSSLRASVIQELTKDIKLEFKTNEENQHNV